MFLKMAKIMLTILVGLFALANLWGVVEDYRAGGDLVAPIFWSFVFVMLTFFCIGKFFHKKKSHEKD